MTRCLVPRCILYGGYTVKHSNRTLSHIHVYFNNKTETKTILTTTIIKKIINTIIHNVLCYYYYLLLVLLVLLVLYNTEISTRLRLYLSVSVYHKPDMKRLKFVTFLIGTI